MYAKPFFLFSFGREEQRIRRFLQACEFDGGDEWPQSGQYPAVFVWGHPPVHRTMSADARIFNSMSELESLTDVRLSSRRLALHGLRPALLPRSNRQDSPAMYRLFVFGTEVLSLRRGFISIDDQTGTRLHRRLCRTAIRAVYALGLDFAEVTLRVHSERDVRIAGIDPAPSLASETEQRWADSIRTFVKEYMHRDDEQRRGIDPIPSQIVIGCDCEFVLVRKQTGRVVSAHRYFPRHGRLGCDGWRDRHLGLIMPLAEIRPRPRLEPAALVMEIRRVLRQAAVRTASEELEWRAGGMPLPGFPLGGHIHFSGITCTTELLRVLDSYLALPLFMLERDEEQRRRPRYGFLGDVRPKAHGGFEYRTLPSWIVSPRIALAVLTMAHFLARFSPKLNFRPLDELAVQEAYYAGDKTRLIPIVRRLKDNLFAMQAFRPWRKQAGLLLEQALMNNRWPSDRDMRRFWKLGAGETKAETDSANPIVL